MIQAYIDAAMARARYELIDEEFVRMPQYCNVEYGYREGKFFHQEMPVPWY
jgi:hypothetical protein